MPDAEFNQFLLTEALRQDAAIHKMAAQLSTKNGLLLIFAAFVLAAESTFVVVTLMFGLQLPRWGWGAALLLCIVSIGVLLRSVWLETYSVPPLISSLRQQAEEFLSFDKGKQLTNAEQMGNFREKFIDSVSCCVRDNLQANAKIRANMKFACLLIGASVLCLVGCLLWILI